jgi:sugar lactone lactonase YvrE
MINTACSLQPLAWQPPTKPVLEGKLSLNEKLKETRKIDLQGWCGPEDIIMDDTGNLYCGVHKAPEDFSDGKILKIHPDGKVEIFYDAGSWVAGLHFDAKDNLVALSHKDGLISISPNKEVTKLAQADKKGRPFLIPNGLDIASDGMIYFSNTSDESAYDIKYGRKIILEMKPEGALYQYNPHTQQVTTLIDGTFFGNGVVLSQQEDFLLMTETTRYRILRYWLKGAQKGKTEVFKENLPGFPNGISIRPDGSFWVGFTTLRNDALDNIHPKKGMKKLVYALPEFMQPQQVNFGMVMHMSDQGETLEMLYDPSGVYVPEAGAVKEFDEKLYLGGDIVPYISVYSLPKNRLP